MDDGFVPPTSQSIVWAARSGTDDGFATSTNRLIGVRCLQGGEAKDGICAMGQPTLAHTPARYPARYGSLVSLHLFLELLPWRSRARTHTKSRPVRPNSPARACAASSKGFSFLSPACRAARRRSSPPRPSVANHSVWDAAFRVFTSLIRLRTDSLPAATTHSDQLLEPRQTRLWHRLRSAA